MRNPNVLNLTSMKTTLKQDDIIAVWNFIKKYSYVLVAAFFVFLAMYLRLTNLDHVSGDYNQFLRHWMDEIVNLGGFASLGTAIGDYSPPYVIILTILSYFPTPDSTTPFLIPIKQVSVIFDLVLAIGIFFLVASLLKKDEERFPKATLAGVVTLYLPTIFLNSAIWGQADSIYTAFIVWALYFYVTKKHLWGMVMFAIAFSFKLQAIFIVPLLVMMYLLNRPKQLWHIVLIPIIYFLFCIPALIGGRPLGDLLTIYVHQTNTYQLLTLNMPNMYQWFPADTYRYGMLAPYGVALFALLMAIAFFYLVIKKLRISKDSIIDIALWSVLMANFFLPAMHERYLYMADGLSLAYYITKKRHMWVPLLVNLISLFAYFPFLFGMEPVPHEYVAVGYAVLIVLFTRQVFNDLTPRDETIAPELA